MLPVAGTTLLGWLVARLGPAFAETIVCGSDPSVVAPGLAARFAPDHRSGAGPLGGIEAGLAASRHDVVFAVACDMPRVPEVLARWLVKASSGHDAAVPRLLGRAEPTCAAYRASSLALISEQLERGGFRAADALARLRVRYADERELTALGVTALQLANLNTPEEYEVFLRTPPG